ncbi:MAG TPA: SRPBCC domain-containing protein [Stellaceae bacterium]|nr:SRPBCC domain-containing protein [Stellaceae bacterium]
MKATSAPTGTTLRLSRRFRAPRERVFRAFTEAEMLKRWWGPKGFALPKAEIDLRPGGGYHFEMIAGGSFQAQAGAVLRLSGTFREIRPYERLAYTFVWGQGDWAGSETLVTLDFHEVGGETELILTHALLPEESAADAHRSGWTSALDRLDDIFTGR